ncbi:hypothetical protein GBA52_006824 [Prunus armeniaca]|nr:hypothetical protein GBA52_006824 [Prunus armeniaca]
MVPMQTIRSRVQFLKITALSLVFCVSVVFGNISLRYLPVSFNQAIGATTPFFTAVFAYFMTLKREAWLTYLTLVPVVTGVIIASGGEPSFHLFGFLICVAATAARALKSVLQGILLSSEGEKLNSMNLLLYMAPIAVVFLLPATLIMEENVVGITLALARDDVKIIWYLLFNSALAYFVNLTNFLVTKHTSALTLQVLGNAKGAVAVVVSILIFRNPVSVTGMMVKPRNEVNDDSGKASGGTSYVLFSILREQRWSSWRQWINHFNFSACLHLRLVFLFRSCGCCGIEFHPPYSPLLAPALQFRLAIRYRLSFVGFFSTRCVYQFNAYMIG